MGESITAAVQGPGAGDRIRAVTDRPGSPFLVVPVPDNVTVPVETLAAAIQAVMNLYTSSSAVGRALEGVAEVPSPQLLAALRNREAAWRDLENRYGLLSAEDVAAAAGSKAKNRSEYASHLARRHRIVGFRRSGRAAYPAFQFDADGKPAPGLASVLAVFAEAGWSPESTALWFTAANGYLDDNDPAAVLWSDPDAVLFAASNATADW